MAYQSISMIHRVVWALKQNENDQYYLTYF